MGRPMKDVFVTEFSKLAALPDRDLATPALTIARLECPKLNPEPYLEKLDAMGAAAGGADGERVPARRADLGYCVPCAQRLPLRRAAFVGNRDRYEDPRNSCLNEVLDRRTGIPITLSLVYMEVARRAGLQVDGINFPGHFLVRCPEARTAARPHHRPVPRRRAALGARLPRAAAAARRDGGRVQQVAAGAGDAAADHRRGCC